MFTRKGGTHHVVLVRLWDPLKCGETPLILTGRGGTQDAVVLGLGDPLKCGAPLIFTRKVVGLGDTLKCGEAPFICTRNGVT